MMLYILVCNALKQSCIFHRTLKKKLTPVCPKWMTFATSHICSLKMTIDWSIKAKLVSDKETPSSSLHTVTLLQIWKLMLHVCVCAGCYNYLFRMQALDAIRDSGKTLFCLCVVYCSCLVKTTGYWKMFEVNSHKFHMNTKVLLCSV